MHFQPQQCEMLSSKQSTTARFAR